MAVKHPLKKLAMHRYNKFGPPNQQLGQRGIMVDMEENKKKSSGVWSAALLLMLLAAYPLSTGPAVALAGASGCNASLMRFIRVVYYPLEHLPDPIRRAFDDAMEGWWNAWDFHNLRDPYDAPEGC